MPYPFPSATELREQAITVLKRHIDRLKQEQHSIDSASARKRWQSAITRQIRLNRINRIETAKHIVERRRQEKVREEARKRQPRPHSPSMAQKNDTRKDNRKARMNANRKATQHLREEERYIQKTIALEMVADGEEQQRAMEELRLAHQQMQMDARKIAFEIGGN